MGVWMMFGLFLAAVMAANGEDVVDPRLGLLSDLLGQTPTGDAGGKQPDSSNLQEGRTPAPKVCCCSSGPACPTFKDDSTDDVNENLASFIDIRIVNNPTVVAQNCPAGKTTCCYATADDVASLGASCLPPGETGEKWNQLCPENVPPVGGGVKGCGERSFQQISGLGKGEASPEEFPWTCLVLDGKNNFIGSCAIIPEKSDNSIIGGTRKVVTAAHKLKNVGPRDVLKVRVLEYDASAFRSPPEKEKHQEFTVVKITINPGYKPGRFLNDFAVLTVEKPIDLLTHNGINAACLPSCPEMFDSKFSNGTGTRCWVAGWGRDKANGKLQNIMHKVDLPMYDFAHCEQSLKNALAADGKQSAANSLKLHPSEICAGGEAGKDACDGDGGAPLVCQANSGRWYAVGLVTWGVNCALSDVPGVYARLTYFKDWLDKI